MKKASLNKGFTLLELILAMGILAILVSALFVMINTSMRAARALEVDQLREQEVTGFIDLCQQSFRTLPSEAIIQGEVREDRGNFVKAIILQDASTAFNWGDPSVGGGQTILMPKRQNDGSFSVTVNTESGDNNKNSRSLNLIKNVQDLKWRFFDPRAGSWSEEWRDPAFRPSLIEMTLSLPEAEKPTKFTFWIPPLTKPPEQITPPNQPNQPNVNAPPS
jgi:general secretion pathway protein J